MQALSVPSVSAGLHVPGNLGCHGSCFTPATCPILVRCGKSFYPSYMSDSGNMYHKMYQYIAGNWISHDCTPPNLSPAQDPRYDNTRDGFVLHVGNCIGVPPVAPLSFPYCAWHHAQFWQQENFVGSVFFCLAGSPMPVA